MRQGIGAGVGGGAIDDFVGVVEAEGNGVAVLQLAALGLFAIDEQSAALAAILNVELAGFGDDGGAIPRDAAVGELQVIAGFRAAADQEGHLRHTDVAARAVR